MRLLVHGGTIYEQRQRVGVWPKSILPGTLEDTYGLFSDVYSFGVGLWGYQPFLVIRKIHIHLQRPYPIAILLDPGPEIWEDCGWNAAYLAFALFDKEGSLGQQLFTAPEKFDSEYAVEHLLASLNLKESIKKDLSGPGSDELPEVDEARFKELWFGVGASHLSTWMALPLEAAGFKQRPSLFNVAWLLNKMPSAFRLGSGWLIGGSKIHGEVLGARLVIDERLSLSAKTVDVEAITSLTMRGATLLSAFDAYKEKALHSKLWDDSLRQPIERSLERPLDAEAVQSDLSFTRFFDDFIFLGNLLRGSKDAKTPASGIEITDALIREAEERLAGECILREQIRVAGYDLAASQSSEAFLSKDRTRFILAQWFIQKEFAWFSHLEQKDRGLTEKLDSQTLVKTFVSQWKLRGEELGIQILQVFPRETRAKIWQGLIKSEEKCGPIQDLLLKAVIDLKSGGDEGEDSRRLILTLAESALEHSLAKGHPLILWKRSWDNPVLKPYVSSWLTNQAKRRASVGVDDWPALYLIFGEDSGGTQWTANQLDLNRASSMIKFLLNEVRHQRDLKDDAKRWLNDLALPPLRTGLFIEDKLEIIATIDGNWKDLKFIRALYRGIDPKKIDAPDAARTDPDILFKELEDMARLDHNKVTEFIPNLEKLIEFFDSRGIDFHKAGSFMKPIIPTLSWSRAAGWLKGWRILDSQMFQDEFSRLILKSDETISNSFNPSFYQPDKLVSLFNALFYEPLEIYDVCYRSRVKELITSFGNSREIRQAVEQAYTVSKYDQSRQGIFLRRFPKQKSPLLEFIEKIAPELKPEIALSLERQRKRQEEEAEKQNKQSFRDLLFYRGSGFDVQYRAEVESKVSGNLSSQRLLKSILEEADEGEKKAFARRFKGSPLLELLPEQTKRRINDYVTQQSAEEMRAILKDNLIGILYDQRASRPFPTPLKELLEQQGENPAFKAIVESELMQCIRNREQLKIFWEYYQSKEAVLEPLFECISDNKELQDDLIKSIYSYSPLVYEDMARATYCILCDNIEAVYLYEAQPLEELSLSIYQVSLLRSLADNDRREIKEIRDRIGIDYHGINSETIDFFLTDILSGVEQANDISDEYQEAGENNQGQPGWLVVAEEQPNKKRASGNKNETSTRGTGKSAKESSSKSKGRKRVTIRKSGSKTTKRKGKA